MEKPDRKNRQNGLKHKTCKALGILGDYQRGGVKAGRPARKRHRGTFKKQDLSHIKEKKKKRAFNASASCLPYASET
jgi:hypothetical protein